MPSITTLTEIHDLSSVTDAELIAIVNDPDATPANFCLAEIALAERASGGRGFVCRGCGRVFTTGSGPYCAGCLANSPG